MTPKEEQKCQHIWCDIKGSECGKCHLCGAEKPPIPPWEERFDHNWDYDGSWQVPDRDMIKDFIRTLLQEQKETLQVLNEGHKMEWLELGKKQGAELKKEELLRVIEGMKKRAICDVAPCSRIHIHDRDGVYVEALEELKRTITGV